MGFLWFKRKPLPVVYEPIQCPNTHCRSGCFVKIKPVYRGGLEWGADDRDVGSMVQCLRCGSLYAYDLERKATWLLPGFLQPHGFGSAVGPGGPGPKAPDPPPEPADIDDGEPFPGL